MIPSISTPILFTAYTAFSVAGMVLVKYATPALKSALAQGHSVLYPSLLVAGGGGMYIIGFLVWMVILSRSPLTIAYPVAVGLTMAFSTVCAVLILRENLTWNITLGTILVFVGIILLARN